MRAVTGTQLVTRALKLLGAIEATQTPTASEIADGLEHLNDLLDAWSIRKFRLRGFARRAFQMSSGTASYTLGPAGADWTNAIPTHIERVSVVSDRSASPVIEIPIGLPLSVAEYQAVPDKAVSASWPTRIYVDERAVDRKVTIYPLPIPNVDTVDLILYLGEEVAAFADAVTTYYLPNGSARAVLYNLALAMAPDWDRTPSTDIVTIARTDLDALEASNVRVPDLMLEPVVTSRGALTDVDWG